MKCSDFEKNIDAYFDDSLDEEQLKAMEEHCGSCASCARLTQLHSFVIASLNNTETVRAPEWLSKRILASVESEVPVNIEEFAPADTKFSPAHGYADSLDCGIFEKNVATYIEGFLGDEFHGSMEEHLASCSHCKRMVDIYETVLYSLNTAEPVKAPENLAERILSVVKIESAETAKLPDVVKSNFRYGLYTGALAAAGSLVAASVFLAGNIIRGASGMGNLESLWYNFLALPLVMKAWIAGIIPDDLWIQINHFLEPLKLPYISLSIQPYYFVLFIVLATSAWIYLKKSAISYSTNTYSPY